MEKNYFKLLFGVYSFALVLCGITRVLLVMRFMDYSTGFYLMETGISTVYNICLAVAVICLFGASWLRRVTGEYPVHHTSKLTGVLALVVGLSIGAFVLLDNPYPPMEQSYSPMLITFRNLGSVVLGILAALTFLLFGIGWLRGKVSSLAMVPALFASIWQVFMLVTRFNGYTTLTTIPDNLLAVLFMMFSTLFFTGHARTVFGFSRKDGRNYAIPSGLCASLCGFILVIPNYTAMAVKGIGMPATMLGNWESVYILALSVYALVFVAGMARSIKRV